MVKRQDTTEADKPAPPSQPPAVSKHLLQRTMSRTQGTAGATLSFSETDAGAKAATGDCAASPAPAATAAAPAAAPTTAATAAAAAAATAAAERADLTKTNLAAIAAAATAPPAKPPRKKAAAPKAAKAPKATTATAKRKVAGPPAKERPAKVTAAARPRRSTLPASTNDSADDDLFESDEEDEEDRLPARKPAAFPLPTDGKFTSSKFPLPNFGGCPDFAPPLPWMALGCEALTEENAPGRQFILLKTHAPYAKCLSMVKKCRLGGATARCAPAAWGARLWVWAGLRTVAERLSSLDTGGCTWRGRRCAPKPAHSAPLAIQVSRHGGPRLSRLAGHDHEDLPQEEGDGLSQLPGHVWRHSD